MRDFDLDFEEFLIILEHKNYELTEYIKERIKNRKSFDTKEELKKEMESTLCIIQKIYEIDKIISKSKPRNDDERMLQKKESLKCFEQIERMELYYSKLKSGYEIVEQRQSIAELKELILIACTIGFVILLLNLLVG